MIEYFNEPVAFFLLVMSIILITPILSERARLPGIVGILPGYDSRKRFLASMGDLPEQLASKYEGNLVILHFDR